MNLLKPIGSKLLLGASRLLAQSDRRPAFRGSSWNPVWTADGIAAESVEAYGTKVLAITEETLAGLDAGTGRLLWTAPHAPERVVAMGSRTAFVLRRGEEAYLSRLRRIDLETGDDLGFSADWAPLLFADGVFYGYDAENYLVVVDEDGRVRFRAFTAFVLPLHIGVASHVGPDEIVAALGRSPAGNQQRLAVYSRSRLRLLWSAMLPVPRKWVSRTDLVVGEGCVFVTEYEVHMEGDFSTTHGFDARSGKERWQRVDRGETREHDGQLGLAGGALLFQKPYKGYTIASAMAGMESSGCGYDPSPFYVTGIDPQTGQDLWTSSLHTRGLDGMIAAGGLLYTRDKKYYAVIDEAGHATPSSWVTCVDPKSGAELRRSRPQPDTFYTKPAVAGDLLVVGGSPYSADRGRAAVMAFRMGG